MERGGTFGFLPDVNFMNTSILAVVPSDWHGVRRALSCYTPFMVAPADARDALRTYKPETVLFGCYQPEWYAIATDAQFYRMRTVLTWFASTVLNEFDRRNREWLYAGLSAVRHGTIHEFRIPHRGLASFWAHQNLPAHYLPLSMTPPTVSVPPHEGIRIGILGSGQPWKNMETQFYAADLVRLQYPNVSIHVQQKSAVREAQRFLKTPVEQLRSADTFPSDDAYHAYVGSMDINLVMSLSETYSYLCAESLALGVPVLTTPITPVLQDAPQMLRDACVMSEFDDPTAIAARIIKILEVRDTLRPLCEAFMTMKAHAEYADVNALKLQWTQPFS